jgi:hypothetical protein
MIFSEQLSAVCFVPDYLQLEFDGYKLTTYTTPLVETTPNEWMAYEHDQYKNRLCPFIAQRVDRLLYELDRVLLTFRHSGERLCLPLLKDRDNVYYTDFEERWFVL